MSTKLIGIRIDSTWKGYTFFTKSINSRNFHVDCCEYRKLMTRQC